MGRLGVFFAIVIVNCMLVAGAWAGNASQKPVDLAWVPELPNAGTLNFVVVRDGGEIGLHQVNFRREGDQVHMKVQTRVQVEVLGISVFDYQHDSTEVWRNGQIVSLKSRSNENGDVDRLDVASDSNGQLLINSNGHRSTAPLGAVPSSLWYLGALKDAGSNPLLHTIHGAVLPLQVSPFEREKASKAVYEEVETALVVEGAQTFYREVWYDRNGLLIEARITADDGSDVRFTRVAP